MNYRYEITQLSVELGAGCRLRLLEGDEEVGGGVFLVEDSDVDAGMRWWNESSQQEREYWLMIAASARPADAYHAYMLFDAYVDAESTAYDWLDSRKCV